MNSASAIDQAEPVSPLTQSTRPRRRWKRILIRTLLTLFIILVVLIYGVFPYWASGLVTGARTRSQDRQLTETPATYGAEFRDVEFQTGDGVTISGWLLPSRDKHATVVYAHGLFRSRRELLERAVELWRLGYGALLYDARNHGDSGKAKVTLGYNERLDAEAAVHFLRDEVRTRDRIVLFGISMGAAAVLYATAETPEVAAVIADSSYLNYNDTVTHHARLFLPVPAFPIAGELRLLVAWRGGFDGAELDAVGAVKKIGARPALFIAAANDKRMPPDIAQKLYDASDSPKRDLLIIDGPGSEIHAHAYQANSPLYINRIAEFLRAALAD
jgi:pimeloyl-ACP methyl ester carboxylesterase